MVDYSPSPDVRYQMHLEYLAELCRIMQEKYNEEYVWGSRTLKQDAEDGKKETDDSEYHFGLESLKEMKQSRSYDRDCLQRD